MERKSPRDESSFTLPSAFVIMPFSSTSSSNTEEWNEVYDHIFRPAFEAHGYSCERAKPMTGKLVESIVEHLYRADVVLADVTDRNANVFYELGIRHSLRKGTIIGRRAGQELPSDLRGLWHIQYGTSPRQVSQFKDDVGRLLKAIQSDPDRSDNPVADYLDREKLSISQFATRDSIKKLSALFTEVTGNTVLLTGGPVEGIRQRLVSYGCLSLLVETLYIDPGPEVLTSAYQLRGMLKRIEAGDLSPELVAEVSQDCFAFAQTANSLRDALSAGLYKEPSRISVMMWVPPSLDTNLMLHFSAMEAFDEVNELATAHIPAALQRGDEEAQTALDVLCSCGSGRSFAACSDFREHVSHRRS